MNSLFLSQVRLSALFILVSVLAACGSGQPSGEVNQPAGLQAGSSKARSATKSAVADGVYQIKSSCSNNLVLDVSEASVNQGEQLIAFPSHTGANQQFKVEAQEDGTAKISAVHSNFVLDVYGGEKDNGTKIIQWPWNGTPNQRWEIELVDGDSNLYKIVSKHSGKSLNAGMEAAKETVPAVGAKAMQWDYWGGCNQKWSFVPVKQTTADVELITTVYQKLDGALLNPERGFHTNTAMVTSDVWGAPQGESAYLDVRKAGLTLVRGIAVLDKHRYGPLPDTTLNEIRQGFAYARKAGIKVWFIAMYNFPTTAVGGENDTTNIDPELDVVLNHIDQLKPLFEENEDVIAGLYNGFIGAWGEWHSSSTGLDKEPKRSAIWQKIMESLPSDRMMTVRTFDQISQLSLTKPTDTTAYDRNWGSRTGMTNQCYLVNSTDVGTFSDKSKVAEQKAQLASWTKYVPFVGETCGDIPDKEGNRTDCASAKAESEMLHLTALQSTFYKPILDGWKAQGCYDEISNRMGYRFELKSSGIQKSAKAGEPFQVNFVVKNVGYAAPFNPRDLAVVLRNEATFETYRLSILSDRNATLDPRMWFRESGEINVSASPSLPTDMVAGTYAVFLELNDPHPNLKNNAQYSIRLANSDVWWDDAVGLNLLVKGVSITQ